MRSEDPSIIRCFPYPAYLSLHWFLGNVYNEIRCIYPFPLALHPPFREVGCPQTTSIKPQGNDHSVLRLPFPRPLNGLSTFR